MGGTTGIAALLAFIAYIIWRKLRKNRPPIIEIQAQQEPGTSEDSATDVPQPHLRANIPPLFLAMPSETTQTECNEGHRTIAVQTGEQGHWIQEVRRGSLQHPPGIREKEPQNTSGRMASSWRSSLTITYGGGCPANPTNARGLEGMRDRFLSEEFNEHYPARWESTLKCSQCRETVPVNRRATDCEDCRETLLQKLPKPEQPPKRPTLPTTERGDDLPLQGGGGNKDERRSQGGCLHAGKPQEEGDPDQSGPEDKRKRHRRRDEYAGRSEGVHRERQAQGGRANGKGKGATLHC
ncbi:hypothetical protein WH47_06583 [Habropoda laboriosa]|uniref:Uncharacterized protein n=1 Tax=Habropoda laboriosa TaxID=597456 RepID=A0A0L7QSH2_9HYME|nr:hypothetical protein WH47_06583 [Habropoda laboriosa]